MDNLNIFQASMKIIKSYPTYSTDVLVYFAEEKILKNSILDVFKNTTADVQCRIACLHLSNNIRWRGGEILEGMARGRCHDLHQFFFLLCRKVFPAYKTSMIEKRRTLCQGTLSIADYGKALKILNEGLGTSVDHYCVRMDFVYGLNEGTVKRTLFTHALEEMDFETLINLAAQIEINMAHEVGIAGGGVHEERKIRVGEEVKEREGKVKLSKEYFKVAKIKGLKAGSCYNCIKNFHSCHSCPKTKCIFCHKNVNQVGHYSLLCPLYPRKL